jgi:hypothetical protein
MLLEDLVQREVELLNTMTHEGKPLSDSLQKKALTMYYESLSELPYYQFLYNYLMNA